MSYDVISKATVTFSHLPKFWSGAEVWGLSFRVNGWFCMWCWWFSDSGS